MSGRPVARSGPISEAEIRRAFAEAKRHLLEAAMTHPQVSHFQFRLFAVLVQRFANFEHFVKTGEILVWPSQATLSELTASTEEGVRGAIRKLCVVGFLLLHQAAGGRGRSARYRLVTPSRLALVTSNPPNPKAPVFVGGFVEKPPTFNPETPNGETEKPPTETAMTLSEEPEEETQSRACGPKDRSTEHVYSAAFERTLARWRSADMDRADRADVEAWVAAQAYASECDLELAALAYLNTSGEVKRGRCMGLGRWLDRRRFEPYLPGSRVTNPTSAPAQSFSDAVIRERAVAWWRKLGLDGEAIARSYLDPARLDGKVITPHGAYAGGKLREHGALWRDLGVVIGEVAPPSKGAAA